MSGSLLSKEDKPVAFLSVSNRVKAKDFYAYKLGLKIVYEDDFALVMELGNSTLRISELKNFEPQRFTVLGWEVDDIVSSAKRLISLNIKPKRYDGLEQDEMGIWNSPSTCVRVMWFEDPDGNILSLSDSLPIIEPT